jgi:hypothetical protein
MSPDLAFLLGVALKMAVTAGFVMFASFVAERAGALMAAMVASLPVSAGPTYVFLALDHDAGFIATSSLASLVSNAATCLFALAYVVVAQRAGMALSLLAALAAWATAWLVLAQFRWTLFSAVVLMAGVLAVCLPLSSRYRHAPMPAPRRRWYDLPLRATLVATLVGVVVTLSSRLGPVVSGVLAVFPVVFTSLILILHPRVGGRANAAVISNAISGLPGFAIALVGVHLTAAALGAPAALTFGLGIAIAWNVMVWTARRRGIPL